MGRGRGTLVENPLNWRRHPDGQMGALKDVLADVGWAGALLFNEKTGRLIDGHARRNSVEPNEVVPVLIGSWTEEQEKKILLTHDPIGALAVPDEDQLANLLDEVELDDVDALKGLLDSLVPNRDEVDESAAGTAGAGKSKLRVKLKPGEGVKVKVVMCVDDVRAVERALLLTANPNRGEALAEICRDYEERQLNPS